MDSGTLVPIACAGASHRCPTIARSQSRSRPRSPQTDPRVGRHGCGQRRLGDLADCSHVFGRPRSFGLLHGPGRCKYRGPCQRGMHRAYLERQSNTRRSASGHPTHAAESARVADSADDRGRASSSKHLREQRACSIRVASRVSKRVHKRACLLHPHVQLLITTLLDWLGRRCSLRWPDDCITSICIVSRADADCDGFLYGRELDTLDDELNALARSIPGFIATAVFECRRGLPRDPTTAAVRATYVPCRLPGLKLD